MATESILKEFVIQDDEACDRLIEILNGPVEPIKKTNHYEYGMKKLKEYFEHTED